MRLVPSGPGAALLAAWLALPLAGATAAPRVSLPRFTEEREAAARHFVKKHLPQLMPLLDELQKSNRRQYQMEVREIFQVTEVLADLQDDKRRHDLELEIWKAENQANVLLARISAAAKPPEREKAQAELRNLARVLVDLDIQVLQLQAERLERELAQAQDDLSRARQQKDKYAEFRYDRLMEKLNKPKK
jgi:hypothetical protein